MSLLKCDKRKGSEGARSRCERPAARRQPCQALRAVSFFARNTQRIESSGRIQRARRSSASSGCCASAGMFRGCQVEVVPVVVEMQ